MLLKMYSWQQPLSQQRLRRAWQTNRSPSSKQNLKNATRTLNRVLKQDDENVQLQYIKKLSASSTKHPLWRANPNLSSPTEFRTDDDRAETFASRLRSTF